MVDSSQFTDDNWPVAAGIFIPRLSHSILRLFTGLAIETRQACEKTIAKVISASTKTFNNKIAGPILILDAKD